MSATLWEHPSETPETLVSCVDCPALRYIERELGELRREVNELRCAVGYWKSRRADAVKRNEQLAEELRQAKGEIRTLRGERFGRESEKATQTDRSNDLFAPLESSVPSSKRGAQPGQKGHDRRDYSHLPVNEEFVALPEESLCCPICGKPATMMSATEDSELLEIDVRAHRRRIRRRRYRATCKCDPARQTRTAPAPLKLIPKGSYGISIWVHVLLDKYASYRPTQRLLGQLEQYDLDLPAGIRIASHGTHGDSTPATWPRPPIIAIPPAANGEEPSSHYGHVNRLNGQPEHGRPAKRAIGLPKGD